MPETLLALGNAVTGQQGTVTAIARDADDDVQGKALAHPGIVFGGRPRRCSLCNRIGHNRRTCTRRVS